MSFKNDSLTMNRSSTSLNITFHGTNKNISVDDKRFDTFTIEVYNAGYCHRRRRGWDAISFVSNAGIHFKHLLKQWLVQKKVRSLPRKKNITSLNVKRSSFLYLSPQYFWKIDCRKFAITTASTDPEMISFISPTPGSSSSTNNIIWSGAMFSSLEVQGKNPAFDPTETNPTNFFLFFCTYFPFILWWLVISDHPFYVSNFFKWLGHH